MITFEVSLSSLHLHVPESVETGLVRNGGLLGPVFIGITGQRLAPVM